MAQGHGKIKTPFGTVHWSAWPTDMDKTGCDGLYVERIELLPWRKWPLWYMLRVLGISLFRRISNAERESRGLPRTSPRSCSTGGNA